MRKIISLGLLAFTLTLFSAQAFGGNAEDCEKRKAELQSLGLYGLCNAWHNADDEAKDALAAKFLERAGFPVPGSQEFACPCWSELTGDDICFLGEPSVVTVIGDSDVVTFLGPDIGSHFFSANDSNCAYIGDYYDGPQVSSGPATSSCRSEVLNIAEYFAVNCP